MFLIGGGVLAVAGLVVLMGLAAKGLVSLAQVKWQEFSPPGGGFRVLMPAEPERISGDSRSDDVEHYGCEVRHFYCAIAWTEFSSDDLAGRSATEIFDDARRGGMADKPQALTTREEAIWSFRNTRRRAADEARARVTREESISLSGHPGRELVIEEPGITTVMRMYLANDHFYVLEFIHRTKSPRPTSMRKFFDSFEILEDGSESAAVAEIAAETDDAPYLERRAAHQTKLLHRGPSPQEYEHEPPPPGVREVTYPSGDLQLRAWVRVPRSGMATRLPAIVYFHGGFAFNSSVLEACRPFTDAGMVVMAPMLRGENGNPGQFELFWGEVDDARAAVQWLALQPYVDPERIYTFGHSVGGGISAMLSLRDDVPIRHGGSSGGLYDEVTFDDWRDIVPFDRSDPQERRLRILAGNVRHMQHRHYAYLGTDDDPFHEAAARARREGGGDSLLMIEMLPGDHFTSFEPAVRRYLELIRQDLR